MRITANQVTFTRLLVMPALCALVYAGDTALLVALFVGTIVGLTDWVDGYLARKQGPTILGGLMDPVADKIFVLVSFVPYADVGWVPWWFVIALLLREYVVTAFRSSLELRQRTLQTTYLAKVKTWVQMLAIGFILLTRITTAPEVIYGFLGGTTALATLGTAALAVRRRRLSRNGVLFVLAFAASVVLYATLGLTDFLALLLVVVLAITWASGLDYLGVGLNVLLRGRGLRPFDAARLVGNVLPVFALLALARGGAPVWAVLAILALEMAHGGLDNLLAHHGAAARASVWLLRTLGASACLGAAIAWPVAGNVLAAVAFVIALIGAADAFWRNRRFYLEERLREKKRTKRAPRRAQRPAER